MSRFRLLSYALTLFLLLSACTKDSSPHLIVVISIDQFRAEYLERFKDLYLPAHSLGKPGGF
jgi:predicted AlkP superfamily pyrophosphatase or phosphodiesterase